MPTENSPATRSHRTTFIILLLAVVFFVTALTLLLFYWDLLVGIYQTIFLVFGFLPTMVAFFAVLCLWVKQNREETLWRFMQEEERRKKTNESSAP